MNVSSLMPARSSAWLWSAGVLAFVAVWGLVYRQLIPLSEAIVALLPVERHSHTGEALAFFFYDVPRVMMLLALIVFAMGVVRSSSAPSAPARCWPASARGWAMSWPPASGW